jgi:hypothetical protein
MDRKTATRATGNIGGYLKVVETITYRETSYELTNSNNFSDRKERIFQEECGKLYVNVPITR